MSSWRIAAGVVQRSTPCGAHRALASRARRIGA
jgi:hypothetical protein